MNLQDALAITKALCLFRDYTLPSNLDTDIPLRTRTAAEARYRSAEYNYEQFKLRLKKRKKVSEEELVAIKNDIKLASAAMFSC